MYTFFCIRSGGWRRRAALAGCAAAMALAFLVLPGMSRAQAPASPEKTLAPEGRRATIPHNPNVERALLDAGVDRLAIQYDGLEETLASYSRIVLHDLTGRERIHGQDPVYTVLSMTYTPERWVNAEVFPVETPWLREALGFAEGTRWISAREFLDSAGRSDLAAEVAGYSARLDRLDSMREARSAAVQARTVGIAEAELSTYVPAGMSEAEFAGLVRGGTAFDAYETDLKTLEAEVERERPRVEAASRLVQRVRMLPELSGAFLTVPDPDDYKGEWTRPWSDGLRDEEIAPAARTLDTKLEQALKSGEVEGLEEAVAGFTAAVKAATASGAVVYPSEWRRVARTFYVETNPFRKAAWVYLCSLLAWGVWGMTRRDWARGTALGLLGAGLALHTGAVALRLVLSGHMPVSNMYESVTFASWGAMVVAAVMTWRFRRPAFAIAGAVLGFLALTLVSQMPLHETRIRALRAVLNSYWLNIHVTMMLLSYGAFLLAGLFSAAYLLRGWLAGWLRGGGLGGDEALELFSYRCIQVGWPLLTVGVFLGGVWAETAWGRFWGWDPKETWALITWIVYTVYLHTRMVLGWKGKVSAIAGVVGFVAVLVTWLGVSYLPGLAGGLHSYASPSG